MKYFVSILILFIFACCTSSKSLPVSKADSKKLDVGSSGMAQVNSNSFLAVYDLKSFEKGVRLGLIQTYADSIRVHPVRVSDWKSGENIPSDLEGITKVSGREDEYLICESGNWQGEQGRIFHMKLNLQGRSAEVLGIIQLPMQKRNDFNLVGDQYEGIANFHLAEDRFTVLLAERGGSDAYPNGILRWGEIDLSSYTISFAKEGLKGIEIESPGSWKSETNKRDLTDLFVDQEGVIWASASQDLSDSGPFHSVIYKLGNMTSQSDIPVNISEGLQLYKEFPSYKIEALSGPSSAVPGSKFSFGTEDEIYGGTWRPVD